MIFITSCKTIQFKKMKPLRYLLFLLPLISFSQDRVSGIVMEANADQRQRSNLGRGREQSPNLDQRFHWQGFEPCARGGGR